MAHNEQGNESLRALLNSYNLEYVTEDKNIFTDEARNTFINIQDEKERFKFIAELLEQFYRNNSEYANFTRIYIYSDPVALLDFFKAIKKSHFDKCGIPFETPNYKDRYKSLKKLIKEAEIAIELTPIDLNELVTLWPILRIRELFTESELAAFYYLQNPRTESAITEELITGYADIYYLPFGPYMFLMNDAISHAATKRNFKYDLTSTNKKKSDRTKSLEVQSIKQGFEITQRKKGESATITILNKDFIQSKTALKLYVFLLSKAAQQNFRPVIYFSLQELVDNGWYNNISNARAGFKTHIAAVQSLQVAGEMKKGKRYIKQSGRVLFTGYDIDQNGVKVQFNEDLDLEILASYYTKLPNWAFGLNDNSFAILLYAFMKARTERSEKINISLSVIREHLALPTKEEYNEKGKKFNAGQFVKKPIIAAVDGIKTAIETNKDPNITIKGFYKKDARNLEDWLKGHIVIELSDEYSNKFNQIHEKQVKIIEANTERKEAAKALIEAKKEVEKNQKSE